MVARNQQLPRSAVAAQSTELTNIPVMGPFRRDPAGNLRPVFGSQELPVDRSGVAANAQTRSTSISGHNLSAKIQQLISSFEAPQIHD